MAFIQWRRTERFKWKEQNMERYGGMKKVGAIKGEKREP